MKSIRILALGLTVGFSALAGNAQMPDPPTAPLPSALAKATKLFIGNAGDLENADCLRAYNSFYDGVSKLGRFTLVLDPNEADLVLELHYENVTGAVARQFRLVISDPRSHIILWSLREQVNLPALQKKRDKNFDEAAAALVSDFNLLAAPQTSVPGNKSIFKH